MDNPRHDLRPGMYATVTLQVPITRMVALPADAVDKQKQSYERGLVLAVPEQAVIDTGNRKIIYRETAPDLFEGVEVQLGPRCGIFYPVIRGLSEGDRVATAGSFLIDAETRLTAGAGSMYFGASGGARSGTDRKSAATAARPSLTRSEGDKVAAAFAKLDPDDRRLAESQKFCPVLTDNHLGSMGVPVKIMVKDQPVFLCCKGCVTDALANPQQTLERLEGPKSRSKSPTAASNEVAKPAATAKEDAKVRAALAKLTPDDRQLAEAQGYCPIQSDNRLGSMGPPVKVMLQGRPVFLCCKGCEGDARTNAEQTLAEVEKLKAKVNAATPPPK
jgi:hypothetical protein